MKNLNSFNRNTQFAQTSVIVVGQFPTGYYAADAGQGPYPYVGGGVELSVIAEQYYLVRYLHHNLFYQYNGQAILLLYDISKSNSNNFYCHKAYHHNQLFLKYQ